MTVSLGSFSRTFDPPLATVAMAIVVIGAVEALIVENFPGSLPIWMPYEFSWTVFFCCIGAVVFYIRGFRSSPPHERPGRWRRTSFFLGVGLIYISMQTWLDYAAQHMFFIHRLQHLILHHTGPFLIALSDPAKVVWRGLPTGWRRGRHIQSVKTYLNILQQPALASFLFVALIYIWPIPSVHYWAMLDPMLYTIMNWSVTIDGILFWSLVLDPRPKPLARVSFGVRLICAAAVMFPQMILGAFVVFAERDLYPVYNICGRIFPISGLQDQTYAGLILWVPSTMMSVFALVIILNFIRLNEEDAESCPGVFDD